MIERDPPPGGMIPFKVATILLYLTFIYQVTMRPLTMGANLSIGTSLTILLLHLFELWYYRDLIAVAPGKRRWNALGIFVFGIFHMAEMKRNMWESRQTTDEISRFYAREGER